MPKIGVVAGCYVTDGKVTRNAELRLLRDNVVIFTGKVGSLRRFKDDVSEVKQGYECGIGIASYNDLKEGDVIEIFVMEKVAAGDPLGRRRRHDHRRLHLRAAPPAPGRSRTSGRSCARLKDRLRSRHNVAVSELDDHADLLAARRPGGGLGGDRAGCSGAPVRGGPPGSRARMFRAR